MTDHSCWWERGRGRIVAGDSARPRRCPTTHRIHPWETMERCGASSTRAQPSETRRWPSSPSPSMGEGRGGGVAPQEQGGEEAPERRRPRARPHAASADDRSRAAALADIAIAANRRVPVSPSGADRRVHRRLRQPRGEIDRRNRWRPARPLIRTGSGPPAVPGRRGVPRVAVLEQRGAGEPRGCARGDRRQIFTRSPPQIFTRSPPQIFTRSPPPIPSPIEGGGWKATPEDLADPVAENRRLRAELHEALAREAAPAEVMAVINSSHGDLAPVFEAMLEKALTLCEAVCGQLATFDGETFEFVALKGDARWLEQRPRGRLPPSRGLTWTRMALPANHTFTFSTLGIRKPTVRDNKGRGTRLLPEAAPILPSRFGANSTWLARLQSIAKKFACSPTSRSRSCRISRRRRSSRWRTRGCSPRRARHWSSRPRPPRSCRSSTPRPATSHRCSRRSSTRRRLCEAAFGILGPMTASASPRGRRAARRRRCRIFSANRASRWRWAVCAGERLSLGSGRLRERAYRTGSAAARAIVDSAVPERFLSVALAQRRRAARRDRFFRQRSASVHRQADRAVAELRSAGGHRDGERAAPDRDARGLGAADRDRRGLAGHQLTRPATSPRCSTRCWRRRTALCGVARGALRICDGESFRAWRRAACFEAKLRRAGCGTGYPAADTRSRRLLHGGERSSRSPTWGRSTSYRWRGTQPLAAAACAPSSTFRFARMTRFSA